VYATGTPDVVGPLSRKGHTTWTGVFGNYFGDQQYQRVADPACANVASVLAAFCTDSAIADGSGRIVLQNAKPGQLGSLGLKPIYGPGVWNLDANLVKKIQIAESKNLAVRIDAANLFNHPNLGNPTLDINSGTFGQIITKTGFRTIAGQVRFEF
jgi:hypothetical protein